MYKFFTQQPIILASASKARIQLLKSLDLEFDAIPANCDEESIKQDLSCEDMLTLANTLARNKALNVSERHPEHFVIAADQLCIFEDINLNKPMTHENARTHLFLLRGKTHQQLSACCIAKNGNILWQGHDVATLSMYDLSDNAIELYLRKEQPYQNCGAYNYEGSAKWFFREVKGSDSTILGLPLDALINGLMEVNAVSLLA
ncbi:Maf family protein [Legionella jordanis]|uniref:Nucleoside triphosphate pyrophosphatase n=1 Tax=Legionella jordanis TaxID=456 RepID=A0A0W0V9H8_9GAMM|nr:nucleoside triphosphate pyrophosphatase [Legionella jordanis]KTD16785.1 septum formation protein Maf [Legionella jordanis]RMX03687.1 Maf-like protein [Legionella jordanis]RMX22251.1 Maf-like protein [Legionella jordanis]VEH11747.1 septum formation protein Maf [Legionella jordanis]HAT8712943.1 septum formation protein Maf [Legionella jordanis]